MLNIDFHEDGPMVLLIFWNILKQRTKGDLLASLLFLGGKTMKINISTVLSSQPGISGITVDSSITALA